MERIPEPELMDDPAQALAYARADFADVNQAFVDGFCASFPDLTRGRVLDLGTGPADIPIRLLRRRPELEVVAVDGSSAMLRLARSAVDAAGLGRRIALVRAMVPALPFPDHAFDAVISNSLLHHLPAPDPFWSTVHRAGRPGAPIHVMDLCRPESAVAARALVDRLARDEAPLLQRDFYQSLLAAFAVAEVETQLVLTSGGLTCRTASDRHWLVSGRAA